MRSPFPSSFPPHLTGHETTAASTAWLLYELAKPANIHIQDRLREELVNLSPSLNDEPSMEELNALPYLDAVVKENLRLNNVVTGANREAQKDDVIPLATPFVDRTGVRRDSVR